MLKIKSNFIFAFGIVFLCSASPLFAECLNSVDRAVYASSAAALDNSDTTADFSWHQTTQGRFTALNEIGTPPAESCEVCLYSRLKYSSEDEARSSRVIKCKTIRAGRTTTRFKAFAMPGVPSDLTINLATRTTCGDEIIESDPFARAPTCGFASTSTSGSAWVRILRARIR